MNRFAEAIEQARVDVVPKIVIGHAGHNGNSVTGGGSVLEALLAMLLSEKVGIDVGGAAAPPSGEAVAIREQLRARMSEKGLP